MLFGAITMFCNKSDIVKGMLLDAGEISIDEFLTITFKKFNYKLIDIEEVLGSALFTEKNHNIYSWAHLSYAEFLAAKFIQQNHFTKKQIGSLIFQSEDDNNRIIPQVHYTASWIASFSEEVFIEIAEKDPDILCLSDISQISDTNKEKLVKELLNKYSSCHEYRRYGNQINYKKLKYDGLDTQLTEFIKDDENCDDSKRIAIHIAYECELSIMSNEILNLFISNKFNNFYSHDSLNYEALIIFFKLSDEKQKKLSLKILDEHLDGLEILYVIRNLYPNYMSIYDVIKVVKKGYFSHYETFSRMTSILECISIDDLIILMVESHKENTIRKNFNHEIMDIILIYCWKYIDKDKIYNNWINIAVSRFKAFGTPIIHTSISNSNVNEFITAFRSEFQKRIDIIKAIWRKNANTKFDDIESWDRYMWGKVLDYVLEPNSSSYLNEKEYFKIAYQYFRKKVSNILMQEMIKKRTIGAWYGSRQIAENRILFCQDSFLLDSIIETLKSHKMAFTSRGDLFKLIIEIGEERGICYINDLIDSRYNSIFSCAVAVEAVCSLLKKASNGGEYKILPIIESENKRDKHFMILEKTFKL